MGVASARAQGASDPRVAVVTGASSGIGAACAQQLRREGYTVYGTSRRAQADGGAGLRWIAMDVADEASVERGVKEVLDREGKIDLLVNNAGYALAGFVEDVALAEAQELLNINFFGYLRTVKAVLPSMRERGAGTIVNISSLGGLIGLPYQSIYSAAKFAVEGWSEGLAIEVACYGISVVSISPSDIKTSFTANRQHARAAKDNAALRARGERVMAIIERDESKGPPPETVARCLARVVRKRRPKLRYTAGAWSQRLLVGLRKYLPQRLFASALARYYGLASR